MSIDRWRGRAAHGSLDVYQEELKMEALNANDIAAVSGGRAGISNCGYIGGLVGGTAFDTFVAD